MQILQCQIVEGSDVYTDGWKAYDGSVTNGYQHHRVHHHENDFARGKNHVNGIESFWSYAKFRMAKLRGGRKEKFLFTLKNRSGASIIAAITSIQCCERKLAIFPSKQEKTLN